MENIVQPDVGNFFEIFPFKVRSADQILKQYLATAPKNATYISAPTQNKLIKCCGKAISEKLSKEIKATKFFANLADEVSDYSNKEQMSILIRYVDKNSDVHEDYVGFIDL